MLAILSLFVVLVFSLLVVRITTVALTLTGLSRETARFQVRSAWTGTGFTTAESEQVVNHPVRRRLIEWVIFLRGAGLVTVGSTLVLSFTGIDRSEGFERILILIVGLVLLWLVAGSRWLGHQFERVIAWALKRYTDLDTRDYAGLLHLAGAYAVSELEVQPDGWLAGKTLDELGMPEEGVLVLGIERPDGSYIGVPRGTTTVQPRDRLLLYARSATLADLSRRRTDTLGEAARRASVEEQQRVLRDEATAASG